MSRLQAPKTIRTEDFSPDDQELVSKMAFVINTFQNEVFNVLSGNIDFENLAQRVRTINVTTNGSGVVTGPIIINPELSRRVVGIICVSARNTTNPTVYPTSQPFVAFNSEQGRLTIMAITGLPPSSTLTLSLLLIGG